MRANLLKRVIPAVLIVAGLTAGTSLLAGYFSVPAQAPQAPTEADCGDCPHAGTDACPMMTGASADPQMHAARHGDAASDATAGTGTTPPASPCTGGKECPMPDCPKTGETSGAGCMMQKPQSTGCPFLDSSTQSTSPCGAGGCTQQK